jgi:uncharacterized protein YjaG (DUF416 family)
MRYEEFARSFKSQANSLPRDKQLSLAIAICKRLFFDYQKFSEQTNWGDPGLLLDAINLSEKSLSQKADSRSIMTFLTKISEITPDTEDFEDASYALNACDAVYETLEFISDNNPEHIYNIGTYLTDTVDFKIQEDDQLTQDQIDRHPLMVEAREYLIRSTI